MNTEAPNRDGTDADGEPADGSLPSSGSGMAQLVYVLYLVSLALGVTAIVGVVIAYAYRGNAPTWLGSHYHFQIRTFWIGFLYTIISFVLIFFMVGWVAGVLVAIWLAVRCVRGLQMVQRGEEHPTPYTWWV